jgi:hypothetical protein
MSRNCRGTMVGMAGSNPDIAKSGESPMDIIKSNIVVGVSAALAVTVLAPVLVPVLATVGRPIAKSLLKGGLMLYERGREAVAAAGESMEDMVAEIRAEEAMQAAAPQSAASQPAPPPPQAASAEQARHAPDNAAGATAPRAGVAAV